MSELQSIDPTTIDEWTAWHTERERLRADPHGFLAVTAIHWLTPAPSAYSDAPGEWWVEGDVPHVRLPDDESLVVDGETRRGVVAFPGIATGDSHYADWGDIRLEIGERTVGFILRPRSPHNPLRVEYRGTPIYAYDPRWAVEGRFERAETPAPVQTETTSRRPGVLNDYVTPGRVTFDVDGETFTALAFVGKDPTKLRLVFRDATSGVTTWAANRNVDFDGPDSTGRVVVDFNRAWNLPCAYIDQATCPIPPPENRFPFAVTAGEQIPLARQTF